MTALAGSYLNVAEADAIVGHVLPSTDERRSAWLAASDADKAILLRQACAEIDACHWLGRPAVAEQGLAWPRVHRSGVYVGGAQGVSPAVVGDVDAWSIASLPWELLAAVAIQAARGACQALGMDDGALVEADAQRGVTGRAGGSGSLSIDVGRATSPRARLDPMAWTYMRPLFSHGGQLA